MNILPMTFDTPRLEAENYCALVSELYRNIVQKKGWCPSAENVFPTLCSFATANGLRDPMHIMNPHVSYADTQIGYLCACVQFAFKHAPFQVVPMIMADVPVSEEEKNAQEHPVAQNGKKALPAVGTLQIKKNTSLVEKQMPLELLDENEKKKISPYRVTQELLQVETIQIIGEALFVYEDGFHQHVSAECLRRLIMKNCRFAVEITGSPRLIEEVYKLLLCEPNIFRKEEERDEHLIVFDNGVLDLRNGNLLPYSPEYHVFYRIKTWWGNRGKHPCFDAFVESITAGNAALKQRILEIIGYSLSPDNRGRVFFVFQGKTGSGKTVLAKFIDFCVNRDSKTALRFDKVGGRFSTANLVGKQLCLSQDLTAAALDDDTVSMIKSLTGDDPITADVKYCPHITFVNYAKFIVCTNHPLMIQSEDPAFFDRIVAVPFRFSVPNEHRNRKLLDELVAERSAIVYDAIQAYQALRARNYQFSGDYEVNSMFSSRESAPAWSVDEMVQNFVQTHCSVAADAVAFVEDLYDCYCQHYPISGIKPSWFGSKVLDACQQLGYHDVYRGSKRRKEGQPNPQANLIGLRLKEVG